MLEVKSPRFHKGVGHSLHSTSTHSEPTGCCPATRASFAAGPVRSTRSSTTRCRRSTWGLRAPCPPACLAHPHFHVLNTEPCSQPVTEESLAPSWYSGRFRRQVNTPRPGRGLPARRRWLTSASRPQPTVHTHLLPQTPAPHHPSVLEPSAQLVDLSLSSNAALYFHEEAVAVGCHLRLSPAATPTRGSLPGRGWEPVSSQFSLLPLRTHPSPAMLSLAPSPALQTHPCLSFSGK